MAKKRAQGSPQPDEEAMVRQPPLNEEWVDEIPDDLEEAAEKYRKALTAKGKANANFNSAQVACVEKMKEHGIKRIRIDTPQGIKWLTYNPKDSLKLEKIDNPDYVAPATQEV